MKATIESCENGFIVSCGDKSWVVTNIHNVATVLRMIFTGKEMVKDGKGRLKLK